MKFKNNIEVQAGLKDSSGSIGLSSQVLSSNGTNVTWVSLSSSIGGTGTTNYISKWSGASTITDSLFSDDGSTITLSTSGGSNTFDLSHTSGGGVALNITKGGNGEALLINKTSGSGNAMSVTGGLTSLVDLTLSSIPNATIDTDRFIVSDGGAIKYRTGAQVLSDIGGQPTLTNPVTGTGTTNYISKFTSASTIGDSLIFDDGTNVGIGTTSPTQFVHISKTSIGGITTLLISNPDATSQSTTSELALQTGLNSAAIRAASGAGGAGHLSFFNEGSERMRITSTGNVGIGTTSPTEKLDLGTSGALKITQSGVTEVYVEGTGVRLKNIYTSGGWARGILTYENSAGTDYFQLGAYGTGQTFIYGYLGAAYNDNALRWYPNNNVYVEGNLGIGTTSPTQKLDVVGKIALNDGGNSVFVGTDAGLNDDASANSNVGIGYEALKANTTGANNTAIGYQSLRSNTTGNYNTANGYASLYSNTTGTYNTANGFQSLYLNTTGASNTANGYQSLYLNTTGANNTANGRDSLRVNTTGANNTSNGYSSLRSNTTGDNNTANGLNSLYSNTTGTGNTANGLNSLYSNTTGGNNIGLGINSARYIADGVTANAITNNSVFLGANTKALANNQTNQIVIGYDAIGLGSNTVVLGNDSITTTALRGNVGIGTTSPTQFVHISKTAAEGITTLLISNPDATGASTASELALQTGLNSAAIRATSGPSGAGYLSFFNEGSERMRITSIGNVGIGTTAPSQLLHIETATASARILTKTTVAGNNTASHQIVCNDSDMLFGAANDAYVAVPEYSGKTFIQGNGGNFAIVAQSNDLEFYAGGRSSGNKRMVIKASGNIGVGTTSPNASAKMDLTSTTQGFLPPRMTTVQRNAISSPTEGLMIFNTTAKTMDVYDGTSWRSLRYI